MGPGGESRGCEYLQNYTEQIPPFLTLAWRGPLRSLAKSLPVFSPVSLLLHLGSGADLPVSAQNSPRLLYPRLLVQPSPLQAAQSPPDAPARPRLTPAPAQPWRWPGFLLSSPSYCATLSPSPLPLCPSIFSHSVKKMERNVRDKKVGRE